MLVGLLNIIFNVLIFLVKAAYWVLLVYVVMSLVIPTNKYTLLVGRYVEPILSPIRAWLAKTFPSLSGLRVDLSPVVLWLLLVILSWVLGLLRNILL